MTKNKIDGGSSILCNEVEYFFSNNNSQITIGINIRKTNSKLNISRIVESENFERIPFLKQ
jgi:hypothetical protein